jgi:hypothetical protein
VILSRGILYFQLLQPIFFIAVPTNLSPRVPFKSSRHPGSNSGFNKYHLTHFCDKQFFHKPKPKHRICPGIFLLASEIHSNTLTNTLTMFRRPRDTEPQTVASNFARILDPVDTITWGPLALSYLGVPIVVGVR